MRAGRRVQREMKRLPDRILAGPERARCPVADDHDGGVAVLFVSGEGAPTDNRNLEEAEVRRSDEVVGRRRNAAAGGAGGHSRESSAEGRIGRCGEAADVGPRRQKVEQLCSFAGLLARVEPNDASGSKTQVE